MFAPRAFAGNPLAVVFDADGLTTEQCQALAFEFHLSETSFLCAPTEPGADYRVRIFTPFAELPFAGHPSVGAAHTLVRTGRLAAGTLRQECGVGVLDLVVDDDGATLTGGAPTLERGPHPTALAAAVGLSSARRSPACPSAWPAAGCRSPTSPCDPRPSTTPAPDHGGPRRARRGGGRLGALLGRGLVHRLRPRLRRRPALGRGPGHRVGRARHRRLAGRRPACCPARGRRPTSSARARSWAGRRCCPAPSPRPAARPSSATVRGAVVPIASGRIRVPA